MGDLYIEGFSVGMFGTNCYIIMDEDSREGFVIDPGGAAQRIIEAVDGKGLECKGILCTHGHVDHVGAAGKLSQETGSPVYISETDSGSLCGSSKGIHGRLGSLIISKPKNVEFIDEGDSLPFGVHRLKVLATPGHTPGSLSFLCEDNLFCGDLIFQGSVGRTDLRGGSFPQLIDSVRCKVLVLPGGTRILPGHGPATTVAAEIKMNPFLKDIGRMVE